VVGRRPADAGLTLITPGSPAPRHAALPVRRADGVPAVV
jgi:hypothetical protein